MCIVQYLFLILAAQQLLKFVKTFQSYYKKQSAIYSIANTEHSHISNRYRRVVTDQNDNNR